MWWYFEKNSERISKNQNVIKWIFHFLFSIIIFFTKVIFSSGFIICPGTDCGLIYKEGCHPRHSHDSCCPGEPVCGGELELELIFLSGAQIFRSQLEKFFLIIHERKIYLQNIRTYQKLIVKSCFEKNEDSKITSNILEKSRSRSSIN